MTEKRRDNKGRILHNGESQRPDGKYMFRYVDGTGTRKTVYSWKLVNTDKLKDGQKGDESLRDKEKRILKDLDDKIRTFDASVTTVDDLFQQFMNLRRDLKESSRCGYKNIYRKHIKPVLGELPIDKVKPTMIQKLYQDMVNVSGVHPTTAQKAHSIIYQMFDNAVMDNLLRTNPASNAFRNFCKTTQIESRTRDALTPEQQETFISYIYASRQYKRLANLFTVLLGTGMRIGEALGLRWCDCDFKEGIIHVTHTIMYKDMEDGSYGYRVTSPKTASGNREIPMFSEVKRALLRERKIKRNPNLEPFVVDGYTDFIFLNRNGKVYTQSFIYDEIQGIITSYNKEEEALAHEEDREPIYLPKISAHILRHTFCTRMCEENVNIKVLQDIMGHRNIRTTMEVYAMAMRDKKVAAMQALDGTFKIS